MLSALFTNTLVKHKSLLLGVFLLGCFPSFAQAEVFKEGEHYMLVDNPGIPSEPGKIEVREFFWYGCPHCFSLEGKITPWKKNLSEDVNFIATPAIAAPHWKLLGNAYFAAKSLGIVEKSHASLFASIHKDRKRYTTPEQVAEFYSQFGVSKEDFLKQMNSFSNKTSMRKAEALFRQYQLTGTPAIVVNGKYVPASRSYDEMLRIVDFLIEKERKAALSSSES
jgi:thiol:disulfide interchange protein DsbA